MKVKFIVNGKPYTGEVIREYARHIYIAPDHPKKKNGKTDWQELEEIGGSTTMLLRTELELFND